MVFGLLGLIVPHQMSKAIQNSALAINFLWGYLLGVFDYIGYSFSDKNHQNPELRYVILLGILASFLGFYGLIF